MHLRKVFQCPTFLVPSRAFRQAGRMPFHFPLIGQANLTAIFVSYVPVKQRLWMMEGNIETSSNSHLGVQTAVRSMEAALDCASLTDVASTMCLRVRMGPIPSV